MCPDCARALLCVGSFLLSFAMGSGLVLLSRLYGASCAVMRVPDLPDRRREYFLLTVDDWAVGHGGALYFGYRHHSSLSDCWRRRQRNDSHVHRLF